MKGSQTLIGVDTNRVIGDRPSELLQLCERSKDNRLFLFIVTDQDWINLIRTLSAYYQIHSLQLDPITRDQPQFCILSICFYIIVKLVTPPAPANLRAFFGACPPHPQLFCLQYIAVFQLPVVRRSEHVRTLFDRTLSQESLNPRSAHMNFTRQCALRHI